MTQGEWALRWLLRQGLNHDVADQAAAGWGGDRMAYDNNGAALWRLVMDSPKDAEELAAALRKLVVLSSHTVLRHGDEVHVFNAAAADWAHGMSAEPRTAHAADPAPPPGSLCAGG